MHQQKPGLRAASRTGAFFRAPVFLLVPRSLRGLASQLHPRFPVGGHCRARVTGQIIENIIKLIAIVYMIIFVFSTEKDDKAAAASQEQQCGAVQKRAPRFWDTKSH